MPDAVAVALVGLGAALLGGGVGAVGAFITTERRNRAEREEAWRGRQAEAADDFVSDATLAIPGIRDAFHPTVSSDKVEVLVGLVDNAHRRIARIELLFGPTSDSAGAARLTIGSLRDAITALRPSPPAVNDARGKMNEADDRLAPVRRSCARGDE